MMMLRHDALRSRALRVRSTGGFTLIELLIGAAMLAVAITALLGAFFGQNVLNEHARNLTWAMNDANKVMERLRQLNTGCSGAPTWAPPQECDTNGDAVCAEACASWDDWLSFAACPGRGKSVQRLLPGEEEAIVGCRNSAGTAACVAGDDPKQLTVTVCWRHRMRLIGECAWDSGAQTLSAADADADGVIESPSMLSTLMTCR